MSPAFGGVSFFMDDLDYVAVTTPQNLLSLLK